MSEVNSTVTNGENTKPAKTTEKKWTNTYTTSQRDAVVVYNKNVPTYKTKRMVKDIASVVIGGVSIGATLSVFDQNLTKAFEIKEAEGKSSNYKKQMVKAVGMYAGGALSTIVMHTLVRKAIDEWM